MRGNVKGETVMRITRQLLRQWEACYEDEQIAELVPPEGVTPLQVATSGLSEDDLIWVLFREEIIPALEMRKLANRWARRILEAMPLERRDLRCCELIRAAEMLALRDRFREREKLDAEVRTREEAERVKRDREIQARLEWDAQQEKLKARDAAELEEAQRQARIARLVRELLKEDL